MTLTLGSLFDGSGGFPLAGTLCGIEPLWASEIEPFPIAVTKARFPHMKHYGDVSKINGAAVPKVDIITFGSPCQGLSVAGLRKGIHDDPRSTLFYQAVRIIKEMRDSDKADGRTGINVRPRFAVWENVPGAFSSNKGEDFRQVLEELAKVADPEVSIPRSEKWQPAGEIVGNGFSIAWRVLDACGWGVPQRRKRIYLIADLASERGAGKVLFEPESQGRYPSPWGTQRQETAGNPANGVGAVGCMTPWDYEGKRLYGIDGAYPTIPSGENRGRISKPLFTASARTTPTVCCPTTPTAASTKRTRRVHWTLTAGILLAIKAV